MLIKLKTALIIEGKTQTLGWGCSGRGRILFVRSAVFNDVSCSAALYAGALRALLILTGPEQASQLFSAQQCTHNSSVSVPNIVHNTKKVWANFDIRSMPSIGQPFGDQFTLWGVKEMFILCFQLMWHK